MLRGRAEMEAQEHPRPGVSERVKRGASEADAPGVRSWDPQRGRSERNMGIL